MSNTQASGNGRATAVLALPHWRRGDHLAVDGTRGNVRTARTNVRGPLDRWCGPDRPRRRGQVAARRGTPDRRRGPADGARGRTSCDAVHSPRRDGPSAASGPHAQHRARRRRPRLAVPSRPAASRRARRIGATAGRGRRRRPTRRDVLGCADALHDGPEHLPRCHHPCGTTPPLRDRLLAEGRARDPDAAAAADPRRGGNAPAPRARRTGRHTRRRTVGDRIERQPPDPARTRPPLARSRSPARAGRALVPRRDADVVDARGADHVAARGARTAVGHGARDARSRGTDGTLRHRGDDRQRGAAPARGAGAHPGRP